MISMSERVRRVSIVYNAFHPPKPQGELDDDTSESIIGDVLRVRDILMKRGYRVSCIPFLRSAVNFLKRLTASRPDLAFNLCEGAMGDSRHEMNVCSLIHLSGVPHTGCGPLTLGIALDKALTKKLLTAEGIPTPPSFVCDENVPRSLPDGMRYPLFVKPLREDASLGISRNAFVTDRSGLMERCRLITRRYRQPALVEAYIEGRELNVSIIGNRNPIALPISEIDMSQIPDGEPRVCDYRAKWLPESEEYVTTVPLCPAPLPRATERTVKETALACYRLLSCRGYARVDIRLSRKNVPFVLEPRGCENPKSSTKPLMGAYPLFRDSLFPRVMI
ncbi:MAG: ATP-grasp domain-containing protein [bacterium]